MEIRKLSDSLQRQDYNELCEQLYYITDHLSSDYPNHKNWFFNTLLPNIGLNREIIYIKAHNNICGVAFLKKTPKERKICTFYVTEYSRNLGVGATLLKESFKYLNTKKPLISMPKHKVRYFLYYIYKYNWKITEILPEYYNKENDEVVFNGTLN